MIGEMKPFLEIVTEKCGPHIISSEIQPATESDIEKCRATHAAGECDHSVVCDEPGWMYDLRSCFVCGKGLGAI